MGGRLRLQVSGLVLAGVAGLSACTGSSAPAPSPTTTSPTPSPSPSLTAAQQLQQRAGLGAKAVFRATYLVRQRHPSSRATWRVWRTSRSIRVDVVTRHATATLIRTPHANYSCSRAGHRTRCFRVAKGKPIPGPLRLLAEQLFSADVSALAKATGISVAGATAAGRFGTCFAVAPRTKQAVVDKAQYCFDDSGVLSRVRYPNGNLVQAQHIVDRPPSGTVFRPYSSPTPVPG